MLSSFIVTTLLVLCLRVRSEEFTKITFDQNYSELEITTTVTELIFIHENPDETTLTQPNLLVMEAQLNTEFSTNNKTNISKPKTCSEIKRDKLKEQPTQTDDSRLKKCCPEGESLYENNDTKVIYCDTEMFPFKVDIIHAVLYNNCIEDTEDDLSLDILAGNPCNVSFTYGRESGDQLFVLQDGSLLIIDEFGNSSMEITQQYCLDTDLKSGNLKAFVCGSSIKAHIDRGQTILFGIFMFISIPCLLFVAYIHFNIKKLRTVHGLSLGFLSISLALGFSFHICLQIFAMQTSNLGYVAQYFMLSYFFWLAMLSLNIVLTVWYFLPRYLFMTRYQRYCRLIVSAFVAFSIPLILVLITKSKKLSGMPSYFYQGWSESVQASQKYFIPPVTICIISSALLLIAAYFGFRQLDKRITTKVKYDAILELENKSNGQRILDMEFLAETKKDTRCIVFLLLIIAITWTLEVVTFYSPGSGDHLAFMEIMNGLQGLFILMIFVLERDRRAIISTWWHDRGSHTL